MLNMSSRSIYIILLEIEIFVLAAISSQVPSVFSLALQTLATLELCSPESLGIRALFYSFPMKAIHATKEEENRSSCSHGSGTKHTGFDQWQMWDHCSNIYVPSCNWPLLLLKEAEIISCRFAVLDFLEACGIFPWPLLSLSF